MPPKLHAATFTGNPGLDQQFNHVFYTLLYQPCIIQRIRAHEKVFLHGHSGKDAASLGHVADTQLQPFMGLEAPDLLAEKSDAAVDIGQIPAQCLQQR